MIPANKIDASLRRLHLKLRDTTDYIVTIDGNDFIGTYEEVKHERKIAILAGIGCSGIKKLGE